MSGWSVVGLTGWTVSEVSVSASVVVEYQWTGNVMDTSLNDRQSELKYAALCEILSLAINTKERALESECHIVNIPQLAVPYAKHVLCERWIEAESDIVTDPFYAANYAHCLMNRRWPEAEDSISTDGHASYHYAKWVIMGRWENGEKAISTNGAVSVLYAVEVLGARFIEGEQRVAQSSPWYKEAYLTRWPEAKDDWLANGWMDWME